MSAISSSSLTFSGSVRVIDHAPQNSPTPSEAGEQRPPLSRHQPPPEQVPEDDQGQQTVPAGEPDREDGDEGATAVHDRGDHALYPVGEERRRQEERPGVVDPVALDGPQGEADGPGVEQRELDVSQRVGAPVPEHPLRADRHDGGAEHDEQSAPQHREQAVAPDGRLIGHGYGFARHHVSNVGHQVTLGYGVTGTTELTRCHSTPPGGQKPPQSDSAMPNLPKRARRDDRDRP